MPQARLSDTWERGDPYEQYVGRWSRRVAPLFLSWLQVGPGLRWVDVGCGTGALSAAILDIGSPASITGIEPSEGFLRTAQSALAGRATFAQGTAAAIPLADGTADVVVSGLVLNFIPDVDAALAEMSRVLRNDGVLAGYVWDYSDKMELIRHFWDVVVELDPSCASLHEGARFPLCRTKALLQALRSAGLRAPGVTAIDVPTVFSGFDDYWSPFLGGQGPAPAYAMSLDADARARLQDRHRERLRFASDGSLALVARAWGFRASRA
jgi:SAM-dependent methyltransferase